MRNYVNFLIGQDNYGKVEILQSSVMLFQKQKEISNKLLHDPCARKVKCRYKPTHNCAMGWNKG
jgi:predicted ATP-dependent endonuclease of OLD family